MVDRVSVETSEFWVLCLMGLANAYWLTFCKIYNMSPLF